jgi:hypothetical protein
MIDKNLHIGSNRELQEIPEDGSINEIQDEMATDETLDTREYWAFDSDATSVLPLKRVRKYSTENKSSRKNRKKSEKRESSTIIQELTTAVHENHSEVLEDNENSDDLYNLYVQIIQAKELAEQELIIKY